MGVDDQPLPGQRVLVRFFHRVWHSHLRETAFATGDATYAGAWPRVELPALFLTGDGDANSTPAMARAMAAAAPRGRAVVIEGHGHMVPMTAPAAVNRALADWLAEEVAP